jgi:hypothetical protein
MRNNLTYRLPQPTANLAVNPFGLCQNWKGYDAEVSQQKLKDTDVG